MNQEDITDFDQLPDEALLSVRTIATLAGIGVSTVWRHAALNPDFPKPIKLSSRCTRFRAGEIRAFLAKCTKT